MSKPLTRQLVVRVDEGLYDALAVDAERFGRTVAQSVRFYLRQMETAGRLDLSAEHGSTSRRLFGAVVQDAGGGMVNLLVDRDTEQYPRNGDHIEVHGG